MKRVIDIIVSFAIVTLLLVVYAGIALLILFSTGRPIIHWSLRVGRKGKLFYMPKFRTMMVGSPNVASHLLDNPNKYITKEGVFLRKYSIDELPQFFSVICGHMSIVGPRPALYNQYDLIEMRKINGVDVLRPGITGLAQISGRDELCSKDKLNYDIEYLNHQTLLNDLIIIINTISPVLFAKYVKH